MSPIEFYQKHLNRVSRSFAFCIERLESPLRAWVSSTYLVCRILDTVEDAPWTAPSAQLKEFDHFDRCLVSPAAGVRDWLSHFPENLPEGEKSLLLDSPQIFADLHSFPARVRGVIQDMVGSMSAGMRHFTQERVNGVLKLKGLGEVNQYCFFVAGVVGETLTKLLAVVEPKSDLAAATLVNSHHFGLFLQKVNLLKDQRSDESDGRFLIPSRQLVLESLATNAQGAMEYLEAIPVEQRGYRLFCSWSLFLGLASMPYINQAFEENRPLKISRAETQELLARIEEVVDQPARLRELFRLLMFTSGLREGEASFFKGQVPLWLRAIYKGQLSLPELIALGLSA